MKKWLSILLFVSLLFFNCSSDDSANAPEEIEEEQIEVKGLFIGNSHTYFNQGVSVHLENFVKHSDLDIKPIIVESAFGGYSLEDHLNSLATLDKIESDNWDFIVLQENSFVASTDKEASVANFKALNEKITVTGAQTHLFMTWAYLDEPDMYFAIKDTYDEASFQTKAKVVPVGRAFKDFSAQVSPTTLYDADGVHPSLDGTYLAATMFYIALFEKDPRLNSYSAGLDSETVEILKDYAWTTLRGAN